jgi:hypothetical protein
MKEVKEKRWIRGSRTDRVVENGKIYYTMCKCGVEKESYKTPMCNACNRDYYVNKRSKTNTVIKDLVVKGKKDITLTTEIVGTKYYKRLLFNFVNKIERRNGIASLEDLFVDLITLFNYYGCNQDIDVLPTDVQLKMMWQFLREYKNKIESKNFL